jgi:hypothetical protein
MRWGVTVVVTCANVRVLMSTITFRVLVNQYQMTHVSASHLAVVVGLRGTCVHRLTYQPQRLNLLLLLLKLGQPRNSVAILGHDGHHQPTGQKCSSKTVTVIQSQY